MKDLFGNEVVEQEAALTPLERKRMKRRAYETPRGYADTPGTGPDGETCGSCKHHSGVRYAKFYHKCRLMEASWTGGPKTDIRVRSPECSKWETSEQETHQG